MIVIAMIVAQESALGNRLQVAEVEKSALALRFLELFTAR
jgi:hypothetical protein